MRLRRGKPRLSWQVIAIFALALGSLLVTSFDADARSRRHHRTKTSESASGWHSGFASVVVDAKTGKVLQ